METQAFRLFDFNIINRNNDESDHEGFGQRKDSSVFVIQMFGINGLGETCSAFVTDFQPFFYVKVDNNFNLETKFGFIEDIKEQIGKYYEDSIMDSKLLYSKKLYGFDAGCKHKFIRIRFKNLPAFNRARNLWYSASSPGRDWVRPTLKESGYVFRDMSTFIYESNIPPLLRFFHIKSISPSGWVLFPKKKTLIVRDLKTTNCDYEFMINYKHVAPLNEVETMVPYKICSFDIEASSSHGDFPLPVKTYKKLSSNIMEALEKIRGLTNELCEIKVKTYVMAAFGFGHQEGIDIVYPKSTETMCEEGFGQFVNAWLKREIIVSGRIQKDDRLRIEEMFLAHHKKANAEEEEEDDGEFQEYTKRSAKQSSSKCRIVDILQSTSLEREMKLGELNRSFTEFRFPQIEGDKVTFIGSIFYRVGETAPYLNNCLALNTCSDLAVENSELETFSSERDLLLAWQKIIQRENPDIVIGYNIFGFDYEFMFRRAEETGCVFEFLKLSKNVDEVCGTLDNTTGRYKIEETSVQIASGQHDLKYIKMPGRIQIDMYNYFRREENLASYKLDSVAGHFIGDWIKGFEHVMETTRITTSNMTGLSLGGYIHLEEVGHTSEYYMEGAKFMITEIDMRRGEFTINHQMKPDITKKLRWCLAKDDVTPKDIFRLTNGSADDRAIIAKYCIQDCALVLHLINKVDTLTGFIEMANICSVPISFLVFRGQGIKLTSYVAKKCRERKTLMPVMEKDENDDGGFEGAIVLDPKCNMYLDNPVACVDYASLYPSSMLSENLSHDSKVWTKEYDLSGVLLQETGEKDALGQFIYDNLEGYDYVNIQYDTFIYHRKSPSAAAEKIKSGYKMCRFAQFPNGTRAIMPSILEELLSARKSTRKKIKSESDEFMRNILDKRQLGYKVTANSLYGQCGARTSTFYEKDVAAATTATGRLLLTYARRVIEDVYANRVCTTRDYGDVITAAECIYGDTDSVFFTFNLKTITGQPIRGSLALEITIELAQEAGHLASAFLKSPHDLEYEKTFMPFCLLSKKRYVGILYENDPAKGKRKEMGIVLKRRDNAPIVKDIYGGIIDILMKEKDIGKAVSFLKGCLRNMVDESYPMEKLVITKSLRSGYKKPQQIAHKVLADRMTSRDPGNKPSSGDRIPFVFIHNSDKKALQGQRIETPTYVRERGLKVDYAHYITNQIMKPVQQLFALVLEDIWRIQNKSAKRGLYNAAVKKLETNTAPEKFPEKLDALRNKEVQILLFDEFLREATNKALGYKTIGQFLSK